MSGMKALLRLVSPGRIHPVFAPRSSELSERFMGLARLRFTPSLLHPFVDPRVLSISQRLFVLCLQPIAQCLRLTHQFLESAQMLFVGLQ